MPLSAAELEQLYDRIAAQEVTLADVSADYALDEITMMIVDTRGALRESPDVLVIEDLRSPELVAEAIEAAAAGHLVICGLPAHSAPEAVERLLDLCPPDRRPQLQALVAETLRGVVTQVLLRKSGGGRVAARELLLGTPGVAGLIGEGKIAQLSLALDNGRRHGMVPLTDALVRRLNPAVTLASLAADMEEIGYPERG